MSFSQALSGLSAQSESLNVIGNNIANSQTVGFKAGDALFADVFAGANSKVGLGTRVSDVRQDFTAGSLEGTGSQLDLAISGNGFFRLAEYSGGPPNPGNEDEVFYSRNGQFTRDKEGFIVNATGQYLTGDDDGDAADATDPLKIPEENGGAKLLGFDLQDDGSITANYDDDTTLNKQINLASFVNPAGLQPVGDNNFKITDASGDPEEAGNTEANLGTPGTGTLGSIESGFVESSNVDLATELVDTIITQRAYQANSTSISTQDEILQTVLQL